MFDIGFFELVVIAVIALLVLGPERMPHAVRMTGAWIGKFRRAALSVREEIEREVNAYEVQQRIKEQIEQTGITEAADQAKEVIEETKQQLSNGMLDEHTLKELEKHGLDQYAKPLAEDTKQVSSVDNGDLPETNHEEGTDKLLKQAPTKTPDDSKEKPV